MNLPRAFACSSGALLLAFALVIFISFAGDQGAIHLHDPVLLLPLPVFFRIVGAIDLLVALVCLFGRNTSFQILFVLWLVLSLVAYRMEMAYAGVIGGFHGYLGDSTAAFGISHRLMNALLEAAHIYLLIGSLALISWSWWNQHQRKLHPVIKMACPACGTHIEFSQQDLGKKNPCPSCKADIMLRKPENLKLSCFFCHEHIEFPAHALGQKLKCPHCKMNITLKEPA